MSGDAIQLVSKALQARLVGAIGADSVYVGPLDDADAAGAQVVLFLYRVAVNADLRNTEHPVPAANPADPPILSDRGLPLDLYYLLTAGTRQTGGELNSLRNLGIAIQTLNAWPVLTGVDVNGETIRLSFDSVTSEEMSRIWTLFPTANYRTSVVYLCSPVWIYPAVVPTPAAAVVQEPHRVGHIRPTA